ncbi:hypothetical protein OG204_14255 [Streptomyces sp. NBC_01387]|uniref:DUF6879 family protein n=1 Tax=unclassified Streptomyces TaxID=2593676 RepID=UPI0020256D23|nr:MULTISPECIES: DUF6879 family protein [unclassified Streptomyces]MCX4550498.1 hypothetical protein [Streptomyces sp. NBC_01500]WSC21946.1 hypothetical protein OIE60_20915 [Streptomyces sp. NBC_01766]WSV55901.1 hypothetical protein OG282_20555 [Streptomyces sp. NBC_01014]
MQDAVPAQEILDFFRESFEHTAWRLETRRDYAADQATEEYRQFHRGVAPPHDATSPWFVNARARACLEAA